MSESPEYPVERVRNAIANLEAAYWALANENERLRAIIEQVIDDLQLELDHGGQMPTMFPDELRKALNA